MAKMNDNKGIVAIEMPRTDGREMWDTIARLHVAPAVLVAHELKVFRLLAEAPRTLGDICQILGIAPRAAVAMLATCASSGFIRRDHEHYGLTPVAEEYLLDTSPTSFCGFFDLMVANAASFSYDAIKKALLTDATQAYSGDDIFETHVQDDEKARAFTRAMHSVSVAPALAWPGLLDLSAHRRMLDIGGGSGAHCIGAALRWPHLKATVFDLGPICEIAEEFVARHGLQGRIDTQAGDMWKVPFPSADVHFYSLIYHDWAPERCRVLTKKSFDSLEPGGRLIVHEVLFNDDRTGPMPTAGYNMVMLLWCAGGQQYSGPQLSMMMAEVGFVDIEVKPTFGYWSVVTGRKPK